jgi:hypothetical protein
MLLGGSRFSGTGLAADDLVPPPARLTGADLLPVLLCCGWVEKPAEARGRPQSVNSGSVGRIAVCSAPSWRRGSALAGGGLSSPQLRGGEFFVAGRGDRALVPGVALLVGLRRRRVLLPGGGGERRRGCARRPWSTGQFPFFNLPNGPATRTRRRSVQTFTGCSARPRRRYFSPGEQRPCARGAAGPVRWPGVLRACRPAHDRRRIVAWCALPGGASAVSELPLSWCSGSCPAVRLRVRRRMEEGPASSPSTCGGVCLSLVASR